MNDLLNNGKLVFMVSLLVSAALVYSVLYRREKIPFKGSYLLHAGNVFALAVVIFSTYAFVFLSIKFRYTEVPFNREVWQADSERRVEMIGDIVDNDILGSKRSDQVRQLLGPPARHYESPLALYAYYLGFKSAPLQIDPQFLMIRFENGIVDSIYVKPGVPYAQ